jgi:DNA-binding beta-propeller fold protein YncE
MPCLCLFAAAAVTSAQPSPAAKQKMPLRLVQTFTLPATIHGHFDHLMVDIKGKRLFATPEDFHEVLVLDLQSGKLIHHIQGIDKPHAVLYRPEIDKIFVTDGTDGALKVFNGTSYQLEARVPLLKDADSIGYDPETKYLYIDNGGGDVGQKYSMLTVVDTTSNKKLADIKIDGDTLEAMALESNRPQLYVNNREKNEIAVVNRWTKKVVASWPITMGKTNVTMALDEARHRLFIGCRSGQIVVMDTSTGKELQALSIVKGVDDITYDAASKRLYAAGDGAVSVYEQLDADHYQSLGDVPTGPVGKTARLVPAIDRYFVAVPQHGSTAASIMVFETIHQKTAEAPLPPAPAYVVRAPAAERLVMDTLSAHTFLLKLGLHGVAPGHQESVILANGNTSKIGKATTEKDFADVKDGKTYCHKDDDGSFYDMKLPLCDAQGRRIGLLVMEIPFSEVSSPTDAVREAETIRQEMAAQIPDMSALFGS